MKLDSERLYLKPLAIDALDGNYVLWLNDKEVCQYNSHDGNYTIEEATQFITSLQDDSTKEVYAIHAKPHNNHIGNIAIQKIDKKNRSAELAYLLGEKDYWNQGYAQEASVLLISRAFKELGLHRLHLGTSEFNLPMQRLALKLDFKKEARLIDAQLKNGKFNDIIVYAKINNDKIS